MMKIRSTHPLLAGLLTVSMTAPNLFSQDGGNRDGNSEERMRQRPAASQQSENRERNRQQDEVFRMQGTIKGFAVVELRSKENRSNKFVLANVQSQRGQSVLVNLGTADKLDPGKYEKGDEILVLGGRGTLDNRTILVADKIKTVKTSTQRQGDAKDRSGEKAKPMKTVAGEVEGFKRLTLGDEDGDGAKHTFVRLKTDEGRPAVAVLGPDSRNLRKLGLQSGDRITLTGRTAKVAGRQVLMAEKLRVGNKKRHARSGDQQAKNRSSAQTTTLTGEVDGFRKVRLRDRERDRSRQENIARIRLDRGKTAFVALGSDTNVRSLNITSGDRVKVKGKKSRIQGREVIRAERIKVNGKSAYRRSM